MVSCLKQGSKMNGFAHSWSSFPYMYKEVPPRKQGGRKMEAKNHQVINECITEDLEAESNIVTCQPSLSLYLFLLTCPPSQRDSCIL